MLFYGDTVRTEQASTVLQSIASKIGFAQAAPPGRKRHELLVQALIEAGELVQGIADRQMEATGADGVSAERQAGEGLLLMLARSVMASWDQGYIGSLPIPEDWRSMLDRLAGPEALRLKRAEGYAFYCLYPENYLSAARRSGLGADTVVIGLRSIGTSLAALVAAAIGAPEIFTVRPVGHPFERRLDVSPELTARLTGRPDADFAVVDEGPGLSGSSFGSVSDWLIQRGVAPERIHVFPSHDWGPGPQASQAHRARWNIQPRHVITAEETVLQEGGANALQAWASEVADGPILSWRDISGGGWRDLHHPSPQVRPPVHASMERRKFLMETEERRWLVKYAGLDETAARRLQVASRLAEAGFGVPQKGMAYGFLVEEWLPASTLEGAGVAGDAVLKSLGSYLAFRARHLPAPHGGASLADLCAMAVVNSGEALGPAAADTLRKRIGNISGMERGLRRVDSDNRLHRWEWLRLPGGRLVKTDAIDHNCAHDFIGCQDIGWDIAGAAVEFDLSDAERRRLADHVAANADIEAHEETLAVFEYCYLAFQIGLWTFARAAAAEGEVAGIDSALRRYRERLAMRLALVPA